MSASHSPLSDKDFQAPDRLGREVVAGDSHIPSESNRSLPGQLVRKAAANEAKGALEVGDEWTL